MVDSIDAKAFSEKELVIKFIFVFYVGAKVNIFCMHNIKRCVFMLSSIFLNKRLLYQLHRLVFV